MVYVSFRYGTHCIFHPVLNDHLNRLLFVLIRYLNSLIHIGVPTILNVVYNYGVADVEN